MRPLTLVAAGAEQSKVIVFVPQPNVDAVAEAMFAAGAGWIGQYHHCSFRIPGEGTFWGTQEANPAVGQAGRLERVQEIRLEAVCPRALVADVVVAIRGAHPYEEPAVDIVPLQLVPARAGMGRIGRLAQPVLARKLADQLAKATDSRIAMVAGDPDTLCEHVAILVGSAGRDALAQRRFEQAQVLVTGELKHHDAIAHVAAGKVVIALGHWASERPALAPFAQRIAEELPDLNVHVSRADRDVWQAV